MPYNELKRTRWTGPSSIGTSLELREDMYAVAFLYKLKRGTIFGDGKEEVKRDSTFARGSLAEMGGSNFYNDFRYFKK